MNALPTHVVYMEPVRMVTIATNASVIVDGQALIAQKMLMNVNHHLVSMVTARTESTNTPASVILDMRVSTVKSTQMSVSQIPARMEVLARIALTNTSVYVPLAMRVNTVRST